jgi:phosphotransferase family enzyme
MARAHFQIHRHRRGSVDQVLRLLDPRNVVIKAHQPDWERQRLDEVARLQSAIATETGLAPRVLRGPAPLGAGFATVEEYVDRGSIRNGHEPAVRRALAHALHLVVERLSRWMPASALPGSLLSSAPANALWPRPHSRLFDFDATHAGAEFIDEIAAAARARMLPAGRHVIGHGDWRAEHVRFDGDIPLVAFDWDSLCTDREPALIGATAHMFCADWSRADGVQAPTLAEARAFVADYEAVARRQFTPGERALCGAAFAYAVAYTSRCGHASGVDTRDQPGSFQHLIATHGTQLLEF